MCVLFLTYAKVQSLYLFKMALTCQNLEKNKKKTDFSAASPQDTEMSKNIDLVHLHWNLRLLCLIYTM